MGEQSFLGKIILITPTFSSPKSFSFIHSDTKVSDSMFILKEQGGPDLI